MIRNQLLIQTGRYIGKDFYHKYIITTDDMMLNIIVYQYSKNFSNIFLPGYLPYWYYMLEGMLVCQEEEKI